MSASSTEEASISSDEALEKTDPMQKGADTQRTDSPGRATRDAPTPRPVPSSNATKTSNEVPSSESRALSEGDASLSGDERTTAKRRASVIHHVPAVTKPAGKGSRRRNQGHSEVKKAKDMVETNRSLREESASQDNVRSSKERTTEVPPLPRRRDTGRDILSKNKSTESLSAASEVGGSSKAERRDRSPPTEEPPDASISDAGVSTPGRESAPRPESVPRRGSEGNTRTKKDTLPKKEESTSSRDSASQEVVPNQSSRRPAAAASTKNEQQYVSSRDGTTEATRRLSQSNPPEPSAGWDTSKVNKKDEAELETQRALESYGGSSTRLTRPLQAKRGTSSMAPSPKQVPFVVTRSSFLTNMVMGDLPTEASNELDAREKKSRSGPVFSSKAAIAGTPKTEPFDTAPFTSGKEPSFRLKSRLVGDEVRLPAKALKSDAHPKPAATQKEKRSEAQKSRQNSKKEMASADVSKLASTRKMTSFSAEKSDRSTISFVSKEQKTDVNTVRREESAIPAGQEVRDVKKLSKAAESQKGTAAKETPNRQTISAESKPMAAKEPSEKSSPRKGRAVETVPKETPVQKPHTDFEEADLLSSQPFIVSVHELADVTKREQDMGDVLMSGPRRPTTDAALSNQEPIIEEIPLGPGISPLSISGSAGSHKSAIIATHTDRAREMNFAVPEEVPFRVDNVSGTTCAERFLYAVAGCLSCILMAFLLLLLWPSKPPSGVGVQATTVRHASATSCNSVNCIRNAVYLSNLLSWRDVNPCSDFYAFVCHRWTNRFTTVFKDSSISTDDDYVAFLENRIYFMLRNSSGELKTKRPLKDLHSKCMNARLIEDQGWNTLLELMSNASLEGFPLTPPVRSSISVWSTAANLLRKTGTTALLSVGVASHPASAGNDVISVGPPELLTTTGSVSTNEAIRLYTSAVLSAIKALRKDFVPPAEVLSIVKLASDLEELGRSRTNRESSKASVLDTSSDLLEFLNAVFQGHDRSIFAGAKSVIVIRSPNLVDDVLGVIANTESHTVMNYLGVRLMIQIAPFIPRTPASDLYITLLYGKRRSTLPRWKLCVRAAEKALQPLIHYAILHDSMLKAQVPYFIDLVGRVIGEFNLEIVGSSLFKGVLKTDMQRALSASAVNTIGPKWINDIAAVAEYVDGLPISRTEQHALETYVAYYQYTFFDSLARGSKMRWSRSAFTAKCWFETHPKTVYVPVLSFNMTQDLGAGREDYVQLSRIAPRLGRCLFDTLLLEEYNSTDGANHWLTEKTKAKLAAAESCLEERERHMGMDRLGDTLAARVAFRLFEKSVSIQRQLVAPLPNGRIMTSAEVFFVFMMLQVCERTASPDQTKPDAADDWISALRDSGDFARAYKCATGSAMNPRQSCIS